MEDKIIIKGARVHNLKNVSLELPRGKLIVFTGVSGSGKSSLAFDTIFAEGQRRYIESLSPYARQFLGQMDRPDVDEITGLSPAIAIDQKALSHNPRSIVGTLTEVYDYLRVLYARLGEVFCPQCGARIEKLSIEEMVDLILDHAKELGENHVSIFSPIVRGRKGEYHQQLYDFLSLGFGQARIDGSIRSLHEKIELSRYQEHTIEVVIDRVMTSDETRLFEAIENAVHYSKGLVTAVFREESRDEKKEFILSSRWACPNDGFSFPEIEPRFFSFNSPYGACEECKGLGRTDLVTGVICPKCGGKRLRSEALAVRIRSKTIHDVTALTIDRALEFFLEYEESLSKRQKQIAQHVLKEINNRLGFLNQVGLDYLTLGREAETLSGGEAQRIRLASQIGSQLSGALYVLDEPTIGLHERDTERLMRTVESLRDQKNTVILVEHDERTILDSDYLVDLGPAAGKFGGEIVAEGETSKLLRSLKSEIPSFAKASEGKQNPKSKKGAVESRSLTLQYLTGAKRIEIPEERRTKLTEKLRIVGAKANNLKNLTIDIPLRKFVCVTGVSGSGKSTLLYDVLYENFARKKYGMNPKLKDVKDIVGAEYVDKLVMVDQSPIGRTPRSNPATYTGIFKPIRDFFSSLPESRERGYTPSRFSFNVKSGRRGGRCEACEGAGATLIEMHFLPPVLVECEVCHGKRFNRETLQVRHKKKSIADVLAMSVDEAYEFFDGLYMVTDKLKVLREVGLGYVQLGQSAPTLSGGEAQRIKLSRELTQPLSNRKTLYLLDEPTVGLHYYDIEMLLTVVNKLVDKGSTVVVIEHNLHIVKSADYIIDLGPEGGERGGEVVAQGTPEEITKKAGSYTGKYLKKYLAN